MTKNPLKMIIFLTLIILAGAPWLSGCSEKEGGDTSATPNASVSGDGVGSSDPLKQMQEEGKLPSTGTGAKLPVLTDPKLLAGSGPEVTSLYPPSVDPDLDNVPNSAITGHPEIKVDNCPGVANPGQEDSDHDGIGDPCDL